MKRQLSIVLFAAILICSSCGLNGSSSSLSSFAEIKVGNESSKSESSKKQDDTELNMSQPNKTQSSNDNSHEKESQSKQNSFNELILVDNDSCTVKITGTETDKRGRYILKAFIENKTLDKKLMFSWNDVSVNGYMCDPFWAESVPAGSKSNVKISFSKSSLEEYSITNITEIAGIMKVSDYDDWAADYIFNDTFIIYPLGEEANTEHDAGLSGTILVDNNLCKVSVVGYEIDNNRGYKVKVYLENNTDFNLMYSVDDATVNGFTCDPFWASSVAPHKKASEEIRWSTRSFEENGITNVETISFTLKIRNNDDWKADYIVNERITLNP